MSETSDQSSGIFVTSDLQESQIFETIIKDLKLQIDGSLSDVKKKSALMKQRKAVIDLNVITVVMILLGINLLSILDISIFDIRYLNAIGVLLSAFLVFFFTLRSRTDDSEKLAELHETHLQLLGLKKSLDFLEIERNSPSSENTESSEQGSASEEILRISKLVVEAMSKIAF